MNILLDTHAFLWFINGDDKLSMSARQAIENERYKKYISTAGLWEITIKSSIGKLDIPLPIGKFYQEQILDNGFSLLQIEPSHIAQVHDLPFYHKDPFDRLMIAQVITENMTIISCDEHFQSYGVKTLW